MRESQREKTKTRERFIYYICKEILVSGLAAMDYAYTKKVNAFSAIFYLKCKLLNANLGSFYISYHSIKRTCNIYKGILEVDIIKTHGTAKYQHGESNTLT